MTLSPALGDREFFKFVATPNGPAVRVTDFWGSVSQAISSSNWMELANFTRIETSLVDNVMTLTYYENNNLLGFAEITFVDSINWILNLTRYITEDDGTPLLDDDSTELNLD